MNDITPKEAIANLNHIYGMVAPDIQRSLDVAIKALENQTTEGDLIRRSDALKAVDNRHEELLHDTEYLRKHCQIDLLGIKKHILAIPPVPQGDLISRSVLDEIRQLYKDYQPNLATEVIEFGDALEKLIDNAQTIYAGTKPTPCCQNCDNHGCSFNAS